MCNSLKFPSIGCPTERESLGQPIKAVCGKRGLCYAGFMVCPFEFNIE